MLGRLKTFEGDAKVLEEIAQKYDESSREYLALKHAAIALWYVLTEGHDRYQANVATFEGPLTDDQRKHLKQMGIDPDADVDA